VSVLNEEEKQRFGYGASSMFLRIIMMVLALSVTIWAKVHYARIEPYNSMVIKAAVSGQVVMVDLKAEGTTVKNAQIIHIDDYLDKVELKDARQSIVLLEEMLSLNEEIAHSLQEMVKRQKSYYGRLSVLSTASRTQKDNAYSAYASAKTQYLGTKEKIASLKKQLLDMRYKVKMLEDTITKKSVVINQKYLYKLMVREGDFVAPGTPLAQVDDATKAKLVLFLEPEERVGVERKRVYLNGNRTDYKVNKVWRVADEKFISSYRAEIYIPAPQSHFSELVKVELK